MFDALTIGKLPVVGNDHQPINRDFSHGKESLMILEYPKAIHHGLNIAHVIVLDCWRIGELYMGFPKVEGGPESSNLFVLLLRKPMVWGRT
jgi:hypothetical protein